MMREPNERSDSDRPAGPESYSSDEAPETRPEGALVPPPRKPPTANAAASEPRFPFDPRRFSEAWRQSDWRGRSRFARVATELFDALDEFGDRIAEGLGLRRKD